MTGTFNYYKFSSCQNYYVLAHVHAYVYALLFEFDDVLQAYVFAAIKIRIFFVA